MSGGNAAEEWHLMAKGFQGTALSLLFSSATIPMSHPALFCMIQTKMSFLAQVAFFTLLSHTVPVHLKSKQIYLKNQNLTYLLLL